MPEAPSVPSPPRALNVYVGVLTTLSLLAVAGALALLAPGLALDGRLALFAGLTLLAGVLERHGLIFQWRGQGSILALDEPAVFLALLLLGPAWIVPMIATSTLVVQLLSRRPVVKVAFNVASYTLAAAAAGAAFVDAQALSAPAVLAACVAIVTYTLLSQFLVAGVFAILERANIFRIYKERYLVVGGLHIALGLSVGVTATALWALSPFTLVALVPLVVSAALFVRLHARSERENVARERLARMVDSLALETELARVAETVLAACGDIFHAGSAQLELLARPGLDEPTSWTWGRSFEAGPAPGVDAMQEQLVSAGGKPLGTLSIWPSVKTKRRYGQSDRGLLRIVAAQAGAALENSTALRELIRVRSFSDGVVQNIPAGVALLDADGHLRDANPFLRRALEMPDSALSIVEAPAVLADAALCERILALLAGSEFSDHDLVLENASGLRILSVSGVLVEGGGGLLLFNDITQRRLAEELARSEMVTRPLVRRIVLDLVERMSAPQDVISAVGRSLAAEVRGDSVDDFVRAFRTMGLGELTFERIDQQTYVFTARDLLERRKRSRQPSCHLTLGFAEGAVAKLHGGSSLGTEVRCQSQGHEECRFLVVPRDAAQAPRPDITPPTPLVTEPERRRATR